MEIDGKDVDLLTVARQNGADDEREAVLEYMDRLAKKRRSWTGLEWRLITGIMRDIAHGKHHGL